VGFLKMSSGLSGWGCETVMVIELLPDASKISSSLFLVLSAVSIYRSNFLILGVKIDSYNDHRSAPFLRACRLVKHHQLYLDLGADIVMESITLTEL